APVPNGQARAIPQHLTRSRWTLQARRMKTTINRRGFLEILAAAPIAAGHAGDKPGRAAPDKPASAGSPPLRFFFTSQGRTAVMNADGSGLRIFDFKVPKQVTWQPGPFMSDGRRVVFLSMEERRDGPGRPFEEFYTQTPTHLWVYDLEKQSLAEIAARDRLAVFYTPALLISDDRIL